MAAEICVTENLSNLVRVVTRFHVDVDSRIRFQELAYGICESGVTT
jgi:hypothetical protein